MALIDAQAKQRYDSEAYLRFTRGSTYDAQREHPDRRHATVAG